MKYDDSTHIVRLAPHAKVSRGTVLRAVNIPHKAHTTIQLKGSALRRTIKVAIEDKRRHALSSTFGLTLATGLLGKVASILLVPMIFLQPLLPLYAADESVAPASDTPVSATEAPLSISEETVPQSTSEDAQPAHSDIPDELPTAPPDEPSEVHPAEEVTEPPSPTADERAVASSTEEVLPPVDTTGGGGAFDSEATSTVSDVANTEDGGGGATTTDEVSPDIQNDSDATTTDEFVGDGEAVPENPDNVHLPDEGAALYREAQLRAELKREVEAEFLSGCISFEHTGYYCIKDGTQKGAAGTPKATMVTVEAVEGAGGDKEIFIDKGGVRMQLTENEWDDAFPAQDISGVHFVWQGMKGGRWQIFYADTSGSEPPRVMQVTDSRESNFNPKVAGNHIVWQGWVDENWEVFLATRRVHSSPLAGEHLPLANRLMNVGPEWEVVRLTENTEHDMFPSLHGDIVTWQSHEGENWVVYAYSIVEKTRTKLSSDGVKSENPRFAITWEERDQEGRARLMSYDVATGKKVDLTSESSRLPEGPYRAPPETPITQGDQAALPIGGSSSTTPRGEDDSGADNSVLP